MMGSLITRALIMVVGYVYPAYKCFKCVEMNRPDVEQLRFWCQYWIIIAVVTVLERLADTFVSWLPLYSEAKLAFIIYLWSPRTLGTTYVYSSFLRPLVATHEGDIDRNLNELTTRAGDLISHYWRRGSVYAQSRVMELLQYVASQAPPSTPDQHSPPSGYQPPSPPPITDYRPSAPGLPTEYHSQGNLTVGAGYRRRYQAQKQIPGYPEPPYHLRKEQESPYETVNVVESQPVSYHLRKEQESPYETVNVVESQPVSQPVGSVPPDSTSGYMTRRQRSRRQQ